jgi:rubrerythrin
MRISGIVGLRHGVHWDRQAFDPTALSDGMSVLSRLLGANWRCETCGKEYYRNPSSCGNCDSTVFERP